jgi:hypothetical protein
MVSAYRAPWWQQRRAPATVAAGTAAVSPKFGPTRVANFGSTTSRSVARRNHAYA